MFEGTRVPGVFERVPEKLRGVFWMKGNPLPEELVVMQYSKWLNDEKSVVLPAAPFNWAWPAGRPKNAPKGGRFYSDDATAGLTNISKSVPLGRAYSFNFGVPCPGQRSEDGDRGLRYAEL